GAAPVLPINSWPSAKAEVTARFLEASVSTTLSAAAEVHVTPCPLTSPLGAWMLPVDAVTDSQSTEVALAMAPVDEMVTGTASTRLVSLPSHTATWVSLVLPLRSTNPVNDADTLTTRPRLSTSKLTGYPYTPGMTPVSASASVP